MSVVQAQASDRAASWHQDMWELRKDKQADMTDDDTRPTFAEVHARRGYTLAVFFPPESPWEVVEPAFDRLAEAFMLQGDEGGGWDTFVVGLAGDQLGIEADVPDGTHIYMSTSCLHGDHEHCKAMTGVNGAKRPGRCKFCDAVCRCPVCRHDMPQHDHA